MGENGSGAAISGVAKYYDLLISLLKAERIQDGYISFLKRLYESALWLAHQNSKDVIIEQPRIVTKEMIPVSRKEIVDENIMAFEKGAQSLETTVRNISNEDSEEWIEQEVERINLDNSSFDTSALIGRGSTLSNLLDNPTQRPVATTSGAAAGEE